MIRQQRDTISQAAEEQLSQAVGKIAALSESNCHYMRGLARRIADTGKDVNSLTVGELLALDAEHNAFYNSLPY